MTEFGIIANASLGWEIIYKAHICRARILFITIILPQALRPHSRTIPNTVTPSELNLIGKSHAVLDKDG